MEMSGNVNCQRTLYTLDIVFQKKNNSNKRYEFVNVIFVGNQIQEQANVCFEMNNTHNEH